MIESTQMAESNELLLNGSFLPASAFLKCTRDVMPRAAAVLFAPAIPLPLISIPVTLHPTVLAMYMVGFPDPHAMSRTREVFLRFRSLKNLWYSSAVIQPL